VVLSAAFVNFPSMAPFRLARVVLPLGTVPLPVIPLTICYVLPVALRAVSGTSLVFIGNLLFIYSFIYLIYLFYCSIICY